MIFLYKLILPVIAVLLSPIIFVAMIIKPKFRAGFKQKIGFYSPKKDYHETIMFHAVSVGEVNAVAQLIKEYRKRNPEAKIILTTTTKTGQEVAEKSLGTTVDEITYFPFDFVFSVNAFFKAYNPKKIIIAETEIWPCFVSQARKHYRKVYTVNGRISPHSADGYKKIKFFLEGIFKKYEKIFMQTSYDKERIIAAGAPENLVEVMGNLKFDITTNLSKEEINEYKNSLKTDNTRLFIAASTHKGEDEIVLKCFKDLKQKFPDMKMLLAPRHPQRYEAVESLIKETGFNYGLKSKCADFENCEIIMLDTMGELAKLFSLAYIAFIGGSFSETGGHNPLEANIWGVPVLSGPSTHNFKDIYRILEEMKATVIVQTQEELEKELDEFYSNPQRREEYSKNCLGVFDKNRGAIEFVLKNI